MSEVKNPQLKIAEEAFPKQFIDDARRRHTEDKYDYEKHEYVRDSQGRRIPEFNKKRFQETLKNWAKKFANHGIALNEIDFDQYLLEGYTIDKCPNKCITVILHKDGSFYIKDKRTGVNSYWWEEGNARLYHRKKGTCRDISKIPDSQLLEEAKLTWVIPEEVFVTDVTKVRAERRDRAVPHSLKRYKPGEYEPSNSYMYRGTGSYVDKSGYFVNMLDLKERLAEYKEKKQLAEFEGDTFGLCSKLLIEVAERGNKLIQRGLKALSTLVELDVLRGDEGNIITRIQQFKDSFRRLDRTLKELSDELGSTTDSEELQSIKDRLIRFGKKLRTYFENEYSGQELKQYVEELESKIKKANSATEGIKGSNSNKTLQATESYYVSKEIMSAFEEV